MHLPKSKHKTVKKEPVSIDNKQFKELLVSMQLIFRDNKFELSLSQRSKLLSAFWETTYYLYKSTPIHEMLLNYYGSYFCFKEKLEDKEALLNCINRRRVNNDGISLEWGVKNWIVLINNSTYKYPEVVLSKLFKSLRPILEFCQM